MPERVRLRKTRYGPLVGNRWLQVLCRLGEGSLAFRDRASGRAVVPRAYAALECTDGTTVGTLGGFREAYDVHAVADAHGKGITVCLATKRSRARPELRLSVTLYESQPFAIMQMETLYEYSLHSTHRTGRCL